MFESEIKKFIEDLAQQPLTPYVINPWDYSRSGNKLRRGNLFGYFMKMYTLNPKVLLVGEAPGYRGVGRVGVPFASETLVLSHPFFSDKSVFGIEHSYAPRAEASASIVWQTFDSLDFYPLTWAAYPFHPHKPDNIYSNRAPKPVEVSIGRQFIQRLIELYEIEHVIAVGRIAEGTLRYMGIPAIRIRHPAHGGATRFASGLRAFERSRH
ncbi:uracil-DNA glycosylase [Patescibacteria group bacterium]|nr:uracil-DNA glycosylase [Patescibacteria group bacterium]